MSRRVNSGAMRSPAAMPIKAASAFSSWIVILTVQRNHSKTGFFVYALLVTVVALNEVHQFKVGVDSLDGAAVGITDNVVSVFILTEVDGEAIRFIGTLVSPIVSTYCGL